MTCNGVCGKTVIESWNSELYSFGQIINVPDRQFKKAKKKSLDLALPKTIIEKCMFYMILGSELSVSTATVFGDVYEEYNKCVHMLSI
jgi:hypothetical protein